MHSKERKEIVYTISKYIRKEKEKKKDCKMVKIGRTLQQQKQQHHKRCKSLFFGLLAFFTIMAVLILRSLAAKGKWLGSGAVVGMEKMILFS